MNDRPKLIIVSTGADKVMDFLSLVLLLALWVFVMVIYNLLPGTIPIHFNGQGIADGYGHKASIFLMPAIATFIWVFITVLNRYPHYFNYLEKITAENAMRNYRSATRLMRVIKLEVVVLFCFISYQVYQAANNNVTFGKWMLPLIIIFSLVPVVLALFPRKRA